MSADTSWPTLLAHLASSPRENGSAALNQASSWIAATLRGLGLEAHMIEYSAHPYRLRLAGCVALLGALAYAACLWRRRPGWALLLALLTPSVLLIELEAYVPLFGWLGATPQYHVEARLPAAQARQHILLVAHVDSKTDLLDHVERAVFELLGLPAVGVMLVAAGLVWWRGERARRWRAAASVTALLYGVGLFASLSGGAFVRQRSPGALDDGAACALLVRLGEALRAEPLGHSDVTLLFVSAEEAGVFGSWQYARQRFASPPPMPTRVINLEFLGAASDLAVFGREIFSTRRYAPDVALLEAVDAVHTQLRGKPAHRTWYGAATDARSFLAHGVPALTLFGDLPEHALARGMHSIDDSPDRVDTNALDDNLRFLNALLRRLDA